MWRIIEIEREIFKHVFYFLSMVLWKKTIIITENDVIGIGLPLYHIERIIKKTEGGRKSMCKAFEDLAEKRVLEEKKRYS